MPLIKSGSRQAVGQNISEMQSAGHPHKQAIAAALNNARRYGAHFQMGGDIGMPSLRGFPGSGSQIYEGPIHSGVPGRTDRINAHVHPGSYVIPADIVSSLGEGNTNAGHGIINKLFPGGGMPHGHRTKAPKLLHAPKPPMRKSGFAKGGHHGKPVPIVVAGGEHILTPDRIIDKFGHLEHGHKTLDHFVERVRRKSIKTLQKLPGPKK